MRSKSKSSSVFALTLAEFAWLVVFGVVLLLKAKEGELETTKLERDRAMIEITNQVALNEKMDAELKVLHHTQKEVARFRELFPNTPVDEIKRLLDQATELTNQLGIAEQKLKEITEENVWLRKVEEEALRAEAELQKLRQQIAALPPNVEDALKDLVEARKKLTDAASDQEQLQKVLKDLSDARQKLAEAKIEEEQLRAAVAKLEADLLRRSTDEFSIRREITGLPEGELKRVAILLDTSSSMYNSTAWEDAKRLVRTWLTYLPIEECALITFNSENRIFPPAGFLRLRETNGRPVSENQAALMNELAQVKLGTFTDTYGAFKTAYTLENIDLILLFTDGKPKTRSATFERVAPKIYEIVEQNPKIPILAVGLGDYEKLELDDKRAEVNLQIQFLKQLAKLSKGTFMAR